MKEISMNRKEFIQTYLTQLDKEINDYNECNSDESYLFDKIFEIKGIFSQEFPELDKELMFNNGTALRDAKIVRGLLNKALIDNSFVENSAINQNEVFEIIHQLKLEIGGFKSTISTWTKTGNICNFLGQLDLALERLDIKSIKYCLKQSQLWYSQNFEHIMSSHLNAHKNEHKTNFEKIKEFVLKFSQIPDTYIIENNKTILIDKNDNPIIFISHSSTDKRYGDALKNFINGLGVKDNQLIYTSHELNGIPMDKNIYEYLRENFNNRVFMIILWSNTYLESPACLNEMGAAWVTQSDYTNIYVPNFEFGNPKYHQCAVDTRKMGPILKNDGHCKTKLIELKDKILKMYNLEIDEKHFMVLLDNFMKAIE